MNKLNASHILLFTLTIAISQVSHAAQAPTEDGLWYYEIAQVKNPYANLITLSKSNDWKVQMGIGGNDAVTAKTTVESSNGDNGVPWIGGQAGDSGQPVLEFTGDVVEAG